MKNINAYAALDAKSPLTFFPIERRAPRVDDVEIEIKFCGVCHSDIHQVKDEWGGSTFPMVPGHEIVGLVTKVGSGVKKFKVGDKVGVGCMVNSCQNCPSCSEGLEQYCQNGFVGTYNGTDKDGSTTYGGYSTQIVVKESFVLKVPDNLPMEGVAPLLCAGITTYSPLMHWKAGPGKKIAVVGLGGLGHMAVKLAHAMGAEVTILSHSLKKEADGKRLGADHFYNTSDASTFEKLAGSFDLMINTVSVELDWNQYLGLLKRDGALVLLGVPPSAPAIEASSLIFGRKSLAGSLIGGIQETQDMLDFCGKHAITSDIELIDINKINEAYERMLKGDVRYRFVIDSASLKGM